MNIVQKKMITSREEILQTSRELLKRDGWKGINIRSLASNIGISIGSIYNYFPSKIELEIETIASIWKDIFHPDVDIFQGSGVSGYISWLFQRMEYGSITYPGFFSLHSTSLTKIDLPTGRNKMQESWSHMEKKLEAIIKADSQIDRNAFSDLFSLQDFAHILFSLLIAAMAQDNYDANPTLKLIERVITNNNSYKEDSK